MNQARQQFIQRAAAMLRQGALPLEQIKSAIDPLLKRK